MKFRWGGPSPPCWPQKKKKNPDDSCLLNIVLNLKGANLLLVFTINRAKLLLHFVCRKLLLHFWLYALLRNGDSCYLICTKFTVVHPSYYSRIQSMSAVCILQCKSQYLPTAMQKAYCLLAYISEHQQQLTRTAATGRCWTPGLLHACVRIRLETCMPSVATCWHGIHGEIHVGRGPRQNANNLQLCELNPDETLANMAPPQKCRQLSASL